MTIDTKTVFEALSRSCRKFQPFLLEQYAGTSDNDEARKWTFMFTNANLPDAAIELTKAYKKCTDEDIAVIEKKIVEIAMTPIPPTCCRHFCSEEEIAACHPKVIRNGNGEPSNSPAFFLSEKKLKEFQFMKEYDELREQVYENMQTDKSAHLDEQYISVVAQLRTINPQAYEKLLADYKEEKIPLGAFKGQVDIATQDLRLSKSESKPVMLNLPDILKPFSEGLEGSDVYVGEDGAYYQIVKTMHGEVHIKLTNFVARIQNVRVIDDGIDKNYEFEVTGIANGTDLLPTVTIDAKAFVNLLWLTPSWGNQAILDPNASKDIIRYAIQTTSKNAPEVIVHYQLGWKEINGRYNYFYGGGVIGDQNNTTTEIEELRGYGLSGVEDNVLECYEAVKEFLSAAPKRISYLFLSFMFLSLILEKLKKDDIVVRFLVWIQGKTGALKTAYSLVALNFFGSFQNPTATFADTITAIERQLYLAKDSFILLDDYHPANNQSAKRTMETLASKVIRMIGDRTGKRRAKSNLKMNKTFNPQGNVLITGEDSLGGQSTNSRLMMESVNYGDVDTEKLTYLQDNKHLLSSFTFHYISYLGSNVYNAENVNFKEEFLAYRNKSKDDKHHKRFAEAVACLQVSWNQFLKFLLYIKAIEDAEYQSMFDEGWQVFLDIAKTQNEMTLAQDVATKYMYVLSELLTTKQIIPVRRTDLAHLANTATCCYEDAENYYFVPQTTYSKVSDFLTRKGDFLSIGDFAVRRMLADRGFILKSTESGGHLTTKIKVGTEQVRVLQIPKRILKDF